MNDNKQKLIELLEKDETLRRAIFGKETPKEAYAAAKEAVAELTQEDFEGCVQEVKAQSGLLSDQQLEAAAGGNPIEPYPNPGNKPAPPKLTF